MKPQRICKFVCMTSLTVTLSLVAGAARAQNVIWQIGQFDHSSNEFSHKLNFDKPDFRVSYIVGQSNPSEWPAYQPGSKNIELKMHTFPYTILFAMPQRPSGVYLLTISLVLNSRRYPDLLLDVNGKKGMYYVHRHPSDYPGDGGFDSPIYAEARLEIKLPASLFVPGQNRLALTAMDDPSSPPGETYLIYDALSLTQEPPSRMPPSVNVTPTVFFREKDNHLYELTNVTVSTAEKVIRGDVQLEIGDEHFHAALKPQDFGEQRFSLEVPGTIGPGKASISLKVNGKTLHTEQPFAPARKWTIDFVPHAHLDIGYTDFQAKVAEVQSRNIDKLLDYIPQHPAMRFSLDGSWVVQNYLATRNAAAKKQFFDLAREGKIQIPAQYANLLTGYASLEELIRSTDYTAFLHRKDGVPFDYANITDVPSTTWSYPSVLSALGLKYFAEAANSDRAPILLYGNWNTKSPFWWQGPDGAKVLMAYTRQYSQMLFVCGLPPQIANCEQGLPTFLEQFAPANYVPDTVLMYGSQFENTDLQLGETEFVKQWNSLYAYPKLVIATFPEYFEHIEQAYGSQLPTVTGDGGPYWEDGVGADAKYTAIDRNDQERALSAEKLSTVATFLDPNLASPRDSIAKMWQDLLLYAEHTFGSWDSVYRSDSEEARHQLEVKDDYARDGQEEVNSLVERSLAQIADEIHMPSDTLLVFNTLGWRRDGLVSLDLDDGMAVSDFSSTQPLPLEVLRKGNGYSRVRFLAKDVPAMGFKCYQLIQEKTGTPALSVEKPQTAERMENAFYRVEVDPDSGAVKSVFDKQLNRELVDSASPYKLNQYLYVTGGGERETQIVYLQKSLPLANLTIHPSSGGHTIGLQKTPYGQILTVESKDLHTPLIRTEIMLFDNAKKIEFVNRFTKDVVHDNEAVYFAFPFNVQKPGFSYEIQNGWVNPARDLLEGAGVEWFSVRHWVKVSNDDVSVALVPVDAPLITLGDINRGTWPKAFAAKSSTVFSYALNNYWHTNYRGEQGGDFTFRYVFTSGSALPAGDLARLGRSAMTPLEAQKVVSQDKFDNPARPLAPVATSFMEISSPDVAVENWKAANDGEGTIIRLLEVGGESANAQLSFPLFHLEHAWLDNAAEENQKEIPVTGSSVDISLKPHEIFTLRIVASSKNKVPAPPE